MADSYEFGRLLPVETKAVRVTWGARAIYSRQYIDLLPDRQSWAVPGVTDEDERRVHRKRLGAWINKTVLPWLNAKEQKRKLCNQSAVVRLDTGNLHAEASPQSSYGYLYIRVWESC